MILNTIKLGVNKLFSAMTGSTSTASSGYAATISRGNRKSPVSRIRHEDRELRPLDRRCLITSAKDLQRNFSLVAWMIRKHLDYTTRFTFHASTGVEKLDDALEYAWRKWAENKRKCDIAGRHNLNRMLRLFEASKVTDGDAGILKIKGGKLQAIEGNRIGKPIDLPGNLSEKITEHGFELDQYGRMKSAVICERDMQTSQLKFSSLVGTENLIFDGYFPRLDSTRGISPLASAINTFIDLAETFDSELIKQKISSFIGMIIYSDQANAAMGGFGDAKTNTDDSEDDKYEFEFTQGFAKLELNGSDRATSFQNENPSQNFQSFSTTLTRGNLLCLDIPYTFFDSMASSYSARKLDLTEYLYSSRGKIEDNRLVLCEIADWKIPMLIAEDDALAKLISDSGLTPETIKYDFRSAGQYWIDELNEIQAAAMRIAVGLSSRGREAKRRGDTFREILEELGAEQKQIVESGVPITTGQPGQQMTNSPASALPNAPIPQISTKKTDPSEPPDTDEETTEVVDDNAK